MTPTRTSKMPFPPSPPTILVSVAEEMNPSRRNTMEDTHVVHGPGAWRCPNPLAAFVGVYDGHGGRDVAEYLEDRLADNVAEEWTAVWEDEDKGRKYEKKDDHERSEYRSSRKKQRQILASSPALARNGDIDEDEDEKENCRNGAEAGNAASDDDEEEMRESVAVRAALERAFLLTDVQTHAAGLITSGATVACVVVIPKFARQSKPSSVSEEAAGTQVESIWVHAANAGDGRAVLSSCVARPSGQVPRRRRSRLSIDDGEGSCGISSASSASTNEGCDNDVDDLLPSSAASECRRLTRDHKSTDPREVSRIRGAGGVVVKGRVLGVLAVARSLGDHGLKDYVVARPHLSSTKVSILHRRDSSRTGRSSSSSSAEKNVTKAKAEKEDDGVDGFDLSLSPPYTDEEFVIVACDGLWDVMEDQEAVNLVRTYARTGKGGGQRGGGGDDCGDVGDEGQRKRGGEDALEHERRRRQKSVARILVDEALRLGTMDNVTVVVYWL